MGYFKKWNRIAGWAAFAVAAVAYLMTIEPTTSMWDCAEWIATSYKLEVGHPPGAPLFTMIARFFAMLAPSPAHVGMMVNVMSALCGAFTILFLCWTITHLGRRIYERAGGEMTRSQVWTVLGAGVIGALAYCFSDTQWFSAVEAEVYSMSSMVTALVFWCILQWEEVADRPHSLRWLILIAYLMGLSVGIHILNLLCIPAIVLVYYFRKAPKVTRWGVLKALVVAGALIVALNYMIIPYAIKIGAAFDKMFVNGFSMPVNSGLVFWAALLFALCALAIWWTHKRGKVAANTAVLCLTFVLIGYSSYASTIIRAAADPPMNSNDPSNPYTLTSLIAREQYGGGPPILRGPYYTSPVEDNIFGHATVLGLDGKYHTVETLKGYVYPRQFEFLFPRMWAPGRDAGYEEWGDVKGNVEMWDGKSVVVPTSGENLRFFFTYQLNHMYWRYFMWNFVGRQNDEQGYGGPLEGNWLSGIDFIDRLYIGPQTDLPERMARDKARNTYFFLPFILGLMGLIYQLGRDRRNFSVVMLLFLMTGIVLVIYFNTAPGEPRERDYVYAGSFYAFCVWIGLGVMAVRDWLAKRQKSEMVAAAGAVAVCAVVPLLLGCRNWDDHDRSHRYIARDLGWNHLNAALPNAIVIDYGDNDTFPLWYEQEVENVRPDVRIMNMSYLDADWYAIQMTHKYNDSEPVPFSLPVAKFADRANEQYFVFERTEEAVSLRELIDFVASEDSNTKVQLSNGAWYDYIPARSVYLPVNRENAIRSGIVRPEDAHLMVDSIPFRIDGNGLKRGELLFLDLLATSDWSRPLSFTYDQMLRRFGLQDYLQFDGYGYRFVPIKTPSEGSALGRVDAEYLWHNLMDVFRYGNVKDPRVFVGHTAKYQLNVTDSRFAYVRLADELLMQGDTVRAVAALDKAVEELPFGQIPHSDHQTIPMIQSYYDAGEIEKGNAILEDYSRELREYIMYFLRFGGVQARRIMYPLSDKLRSLQMLHSIASVYGQDELAAPMEEILEMFRKEE